MEFVDGVDLGRILRQCRKKNILIPQELSIFIVKEVCKALEYAHNKRDVITDKPLRLVHLDISPSNIMTSLTGQVKLIDFGIAKIRFQNNNSNQVVLSGKLPYMAPEQFNGGIIDRRTDIFSLGTVFYEMLTGSRLFPLDDPEQTIELIKKARISTSLLDKNNVSHSIQQILLKMLEKNSEERYQGANGVYLDLVEYLMQTTRSVELSEELGDFIQKLMDVDSYSAEQPAFALSPEITDNELDQVEEVIDVSQNPQIGDEVIQESYELENLNLLDSDEESTNLFERSEEKISEVEPDDDEIKSIKSPKAANLDSANEKIDTIKSSSKKEQKFILEDTHETISDDQEQIAEYPPELKSVLEQESEINEDDLIEKFPTSAFEEDVLKPSQSDKKQQSNERENIFDSDTELSDANMIDNEESKRQLKIENHQKPVMTQIAPSIESEEEGEDDLKTVIDVIRLSTKRHKKVLTFGGVSLLGLIVLFLILDITFQMTSLGEGIYNRLFPPAIKISSLPDGATVYLDNKLINAKTPLSIPKIAPGVHELKLAYPGFSPLAKSIHVPSKGEIKVAGEKVRKGYDPYLFRFKTQIELDSNPNGATVYINQLLYPHKTPTNFEWEVGNPLSIEMEQDGFQKLSGFTLNTLDGIEEIEDRRLWNFDSIEGENRRYKIEGIFKKFISVSSIPSGVSFHIDGSPTPSGRTDVSSTIALTMGPHDILFRKAGLNPKRVKITVDKDGPEYISVVLTRNVRFFAKDKTDPENNEIGANIVKIIQNRKTYRRHDRTPCEISLPPVDLHVMLSKNGYKDAIVRVSPRDRDVVVKMEPSIVEVEIVVVDALTGLPLKDAQISYRSLIDDQAAEIYYGATDEKGQCINTIVPGEFSFKVKKFGYFEKYAILNTKAGENKLDFKLIIQ